MQCKYNSIRHVSMGKVPRLTSISLLRGRCWISPIGTGIAVCRIIKRIL